MAEEKLQFMVDHNAGKLAKWLRMLGFDTAFFTGGADTEMVQIALAEGRTLLTRDTQIAQRRVAVNGLLTVVTISDDRLAEQVRQVFNDLKLDAGRCRPFTRCIEDNTPLAARTKAAVRGRVPPYVFRTQARYVECPACGRIYWQGTHWQRMTEKIGKFQDDFGRQQQGR